MKRSNTILVIILLVVITGCGGGKKADTQSDGIIIVDVTKSYPKKELVLQDFMDVKYIALETSDEFVNQGNVLDIGEKYALIGNNNTRNGDIFVYDRNGKALRRINRMGQGSEEYTTIYGVILDEDNDEIFVYDSMIKKILVYDLYGKYKRVLLYNENARYGIIFEYDKDNLVCSDDTRHSGNKEKVKSFYIISKQDGRIVKNIEIPFIQEKSLMIMHDEFRATVFMHFPIIPYKGNFVITSLSSDTIFRYQPDNNMDPFIVRSPSIQSMDDPEMFLCPTILTDQYYFMECIKKEAKFPRTTIVYDRQEKAIYECIVNNDDYSGRTESFFAKTMNDKIAFCEKIEAFELIEANKEGKLKGKLKEIADGLDEDDNPVIMLVKYK